MILLVFFAHFYGVLQMSWLGSLTRTVRWRLLLLVLLTGIMVVMPLTLLLEIGGAHLYGSLTDKAFVLMLRDNSYTIDPFLEEVLKMLPLIVACMIPTTRRQLSLTDIVLICAAIGSGFGLAEAFFNFNSSIGMASYTEGDDIWAFAGSMFAFAVIPGVGRTLTTWLPAGVSSMDPTAVVTSGALEVNAHLAWSAMAGLGLGLLLRLRARWKWVGILPVVLMGMAHAAHNVPGSVFPQELEANVALNTFTSVFNWINTFNWLIPLIALGIATWLDIRAIRSALADVPGVFFHPERQSVFGLGKVAQQLRGKLWSIGLLWQFVLRRRAFALHKAQMPQDVATLKPFYDDLVAIVVALERNPVVAPPPTIALFIRSLKRSPGELLRRLLKTLTFQRVFLLILSVPVILSLGIGGIPAYAKGMREFLAGPIVFSLLLALLVIGMAWQVIWLARKGIPRWMQVRKQSSNGLLIMVSLLSVLMALGALGLSGAPFLSLLSGQEPLQKVFNLYHGGEAYSNASVLDSVIHGLMANLITGGVAAIIAGIIVGGLATIPLGITAGFAAGITFVVVEEIKHPKQPSASGDNSGGESEHPGGGKSESPVNLYEDW